MYLCSWLDKKLNRIRIDHIGPNGKLEELKSRIVNIINKDRNSLEFTHRGRLLSDDEKSLSDYDINEDSEIHVFEKLSSENCPVTYTDEELRKVSWELNVLARVHNFHSIAHRVMKNRAASIIRENVINADNTAVAYLLHPELLLTLREPETLRKIARKHPSIIRAAAVLCEFIQAQTMQIQASSASGFYYPANNSSGDEEDMDSNTESSRDSHSPSRNPSVNTITPAQLAAAIANATNSVASNSSTSTPSNTSNIITNEMFNNALQQAFNNTPSSTPPVTPGTATENLNFSSLAGRYENQLGQMHELGLTNDAVNIRALHTTSGNLQEAVELVLNGVID
ncbi:uncharacterized protein LOC123321785 [Coccinella septempunctata]|uniref:uncharacterized protein LOC123321785 n=1 Tax=Coccinella septempunctata TaxID=41139 RepID=UPI001D05EEC5|nr:uncharacterized protein LOC123321785 [Coccinella septempunctata]